MEAFFEDSLERLTIIFWIRSSDSMILPISLSTNWIQQIRCSYLNRQRPHSIIVSNDGKSQRHVMKHGVFPLHNPTYRNILSWKGGGGENLLNTAQENYEMIKLTLSGVHP